MNQGLCTTYMEILEPEKFLQLRAKTDRQLLDFIHSKLEAGLNFAALAEILYTLGNRESADRSLERADQALNEVQRLAPVIDEEQSRALDPKLNKLRVALGRLSMHRDSPKTRTAASSMM
jgi:DNA-binding transcriptional MerR regulator